MPIDASIPLQAQSQPFTLNNVAQIMQMRQQAVQQRQANAQNNALMSIYNDPSSLGSNGMLNDQGIRKITQVSPQMGMKIRTDQANIDEKTALAEQHGTEAYGKKQTLIHDAVSPALNLYDDEIAKGTPPALAQQKAQVIYNESVTGLKGSGHFSDQEQQQMPSQFDPSRARAGVLTYKDRQAEQEKGKSDDRADRRSDQTDARMEQSEKNADRRFGVEMAHLGLAEKAGARAAAAAAGGAPGGLLDDITTKQMADQALAGDTSVYQNLGRGKQGAENIIKLRKEVTKQGLERGMSGSDIAATNASYKGDVAGERTLGTQQARVGMAVNEASQFADIALKASDAFPRGNFVPANKAIQAYDNNTSDPNLAAFAMANLSLANAYATAVGKGTPTDSARKEALDHLSTLGGPDAYKAAVGQLLKETKAANLSPSVVKEELRRSITGKKQPDSGGDLPRATNPKTGHTVVYKNGAWVDE